jgi:glycosyltransferase involved in cell wall biosynthesis
MKVLYVLHHPAALSESYIRTEVEWMTGRGVEISILYTESHVSEYPNIIPPERMLSGKTLAEAVKRFAPDIIHYHWLPEAHGRQGEEIAASQGIPITIRGHSFDFSVAKVSMLERHASVARIWLFPSQHEECMGLSRGSWKLSPLPAAYSDRHFPKNPPLRSRGVMRAMAGLPGKGLRQWCSIAARLPGEKFTLYATRCMPGAVNSLFEEELEQYRTPNMRVFRNASHEEVYRAMASHSVYLITAPSHAIGMSVSLTEAMAMGMTVVAPDLSAYRYQLGTAGLYYAPGQEIPCLGQALLGASEDTADLAKQWALQYRADAVFPEVLDYWRRFPSGTIRNS